MTQLLPGNSVGFLIVDLGRLYRQCFERAVVEAGLELTPGEIRTLAHVSRYEGSRQTALADYMGIEPMTLSAYLDRLEARGLVKRTVDPSDRRAKIVKTCKSARRVFHEVRPVATAVYERAMASLSDDERQTAEKALRRIHANLAVDSPRQDGPSQ